MTVSAPFKEAIAIATAFIGDKDQDPQESEAGIALGRSLANAYPHPGDLAFALVMLWLDSCNQRGIDARQELQRLGAAFGAID